jgi:phosphoribosylanthranilate isomerase
MTVPMPKVKFCGLRRREDIEAANRLHPDFIGFILAKASKRSISPEKASELKKWLSSDIQAVGVFVDQDPDQIAALLEEGVIDIAQLHGREDVETIQKLQKRTQKPIFKAFRIQSKEDLQEALASPADKILLDSGSGSGKTFDWSLLGKIERDYFLAGGLTSENIAEAIHQCHPYGLDISTGIETDGWKDPQKMETILNIIKKESQTI